MHLQLWSKYLHAASEACGEAAAVMIPNLHMIERMEIVLGRREISLYVDSVPETMQRTVCSYSIIF